MAGGNIGGSSGGNESRWHVLALTASDPWEDDDIVIAQIEPTGGSPSGWMVAQVLKSDVFKTASAIEPEVINFPFKITVNKDTGEYTVAGGYCGIGLVPSISGTASGLTYINLTAVEGTGEYEYTANGGSLAQSSTPPSPPTALTLSVGYIDGAAKTPTTAGTFQAYQYIMSSLWLEMFKCGTSTTKQYYWNAL